LIDALAQKADSEARKVHLQHHYPGVFIAALKHMDRRDKDKELQSYSDYCKQQRDSIEEYSLYVYGYLEPWFRELQEAGKLTDGEKQLFDRDETIWMYRGQLDEN